MIQTISWLLPLYLVTAVAAHLVMSFAQTLMHYKLGHHPIGGKFFRNHCGSKLTNAKACQGAGSRQLP